MPFPRSKVILLASVFLAIILFLSGADSAMAQARGSSRQPKLKLEPCRLAGWNEDIRCGRYEVFEDRHAKRGRKISLKVVVVPALAATAAPDPVFYFMGGPGGSAIDTITKAGRSYLAFLRKNRDLVFIDQRGTGESNRLACDLHGDKNEMAPYFRGSLDLEKVKACKADLEKIANLKLYTTNIAMEDIDEVRSALGYDKINLYGGSYGSTAAMVYLRLFPRRVRSVTLIGVAPPNLKLPISFAKGVQHALERLFEDCAADEKCDDAFPSLKQDFDAVLQRLEKTPATFEIPNPVTKQSEKVTLTRDAFADHVRALLYSTEYSKWLPLIIRKAAEQNFTLFGLISFQVYRGLDDLIARGMHYSVVCAEDLPFITDKEAERETAGTFYGNFKLKAYRDICSVWPTAKVSPGFVNPVKSDAPVVMFSGDVDPVTPPWIGAAALRYLPDGRQIVVRDLAHSISNNPCIDNLTAKFVETASAKDLDASCVEKIHRSGFITVGMLSPQKRLPDESVSETWRGVLDVGTAKLRLILRISKGARLAGQIDSPDQGSNNLAVDRMTWTGDELHFEMTLLGAVYDGKRSADGAEIVGEWSQGGRRWPLTFKRE
jgi:pimeloyl-ACP methyl ester carboxylesterase